jgi:hypothetical protein
VGKDNVCVDYNTLHSVVPELVNSESGMWDKSLKYKTNKYGRTEANVHTT